MKDHPGYTVRIMQKIVLIAYDRKLHDDKYQIFYCIEIYQKKGNFLRAINKRKMQELMMFMNRYLI